MKRIILFLGFALTPLYTGASGGIQPAHAILSLFILTQLNNIIIVFAKEKAIATSLFIFITWVIFREGISTIHTSDLRNFLPAIYWAYNFLLFCALFSFVKSNDAGKAIEYGLYASCLVALLGVLLIGYSLTVSEDGSRAVGTFNNPNQLGYFSVCLTSIFLLFKATNRASNLTILLGLTICIFLSIASLSKAAMISVFAAAFLSTLPKRLNLRSFLVSIVLLIGIVAVVAKLMNTNDPEEIRFISRLAQIGEDHDDSLSARGYFAFLESTTTETIFGLGSAKSTEIIGHEVHSTLFSVFNNYGVFGFSFFIGFLCLIAFRLYKSFGALYLFCITLPPMLYGITHNGTRFTLFWIFLSLCAGLAIPARKRLPQTRTKLLPPNSEYPYSRSN